MRRILPWLITLAWLAAVGCQESQGTKSTSTSSTTAAASRSSETEPPVTPSNATTEPPASKAPSGPSTGGKEVTMAGGLKVVELAPGQGAVAENGKTVSVHYTGWLTDGTKFDSSLDRGKPYQFVLGTGAVIRGWDQGLNGMRVGQRRRLTIPPALAYGEKGFPGAIPPNATLIFEVELVDVQ